MNRRLVAIGWLAPALLLLSGCYCVPRVYTPCDHQHTWDPVLGSCDVCGVCGGNCEGYTPCQYLKHSLTCKAGCGEIYWGEWISDPPDRCDPCDNCANWVGPQPCRPGLLHCLAAGLHCLFASPCRGPYSPMGSVVYDPAEEAEVYEGEGVLLEPAAQQPHPAPKEKPPATSEEKPPAASESEEKPQAASEEPSPELSVPEPPPPDQTSMDVRGTKPTRVRITGTPSRRRVVAHN